MKNPLCFSLSVKMKTKKHLTQEQKYTISRMLQAGCTGKSLCLLIAGYFVYGNLTEKIFGIETDRKTPAFTKQDGVDYIPMKSLVSIFVYQPALPEIRHGLGNKHPQAETNPIFPMMFVSIACGAISGFHATQSPLMARCMTNEKQGRPIFYVAMISEGIVALIWAAAASYFFFDTEEGKNIVATGNLQCFPEI